MARRQYNISWTAAQNDRLKQAVKSYNKELTKQAKSLPESLRSYLPQKIKVRDARKGIQTRDDLRAFERRLAREVREGLDLVTTQKGVTITRGQLKELERKTAKINRERAKLLERYKPSPETGTANKYFTATFQPKKGPQEISARGWEKFVRSVQNQSREGYWREREQTYKGMYIAAVEKALGQTASFPLLKSLLYQIPAEALYEAQYRDPHLQIQLAYPAQGEDPNLVAVDLWTSWGNYLDSYDVEVDWDQIYGSTEDVPTLEEMDLEEEAVE